MQRLVFVLLALATCAFAGTVESSCGGTVGDCGAWAKNPLSFTDFSQYYVHAHAEGGSSSYTLSYSLTITVFGGFGDVLVIPCLYAQQSHTPGAAFGSASASLGGVGASAGYSSQRFDDSCSRPDGIDFVFGVPQTLPLRLHAEASADSRSYADAIAGFEEYFIFRDSLGRNMPGVTATIQVGIPEPGTFLLLPFPALVLLARRKMRL